MHLSAVESAEVSLEKASADIRLKPDNHVSVAQLRELMRKNGYPTKDARIVARGKIIDRNGKAVLDLLNGMTMDVTADATARMELETLRHDPRQPVVEVTGVSRAVAKNAEQLTIASTRLE